MAMPEDPFGRRNVKPFSHRSQHFANALCWRFKSIERRTTAGGECHATGLATQGLDALALAGGAVTDQSMYLRVRDAVIQAGAVGTSEALRGNALGGTALAFDLAPRDVSELSSRRICWFNFPHSCCKRTHD